MFTLDKRKSDGDCVCASWGQDGALCSWHFPLQHFTFSHRGSARNGAWLSSFAPFPQSGFGHTPSLGWTCHVLQMVKSQLTLGSFAPRTAGASWFLASGFFLRLLPRVWVRAPFSLPTWTCLQEPHSVRGGDCLQGHGHVNNSDHLREHGSKASQCASTVLSILCAQPLNFPDNPWGADYQCYSHFTAEETGQESSHLP